MPEQAYIYILASSFQHLYIGITSRLEARIAEHKTKANERSFTAQYTIDKLVYFEHYAHITTAIAREKQLKKWSRIKKLQLIITTNPAWKDLSAEWGTRIKPYLDPPDR